jgi:plastocyanin
MAVLRLFFFLIVPACLACSGGASSSPAAPTPTGSSGTPAPQGAPPSGGPLPTGNTIAISSAGMAPLEISISVGQRVIFVNNDSRPHDLVGGKDPNTPDCPEITQAGFITPGQRAETAIFTRAHTCEYHDHTMMGVPAFQGRIIIR